MNIFILLLWRSPPWHFATNLYRQSPIANRQSPMQVKMFSHSPHKSVIDRTEAIQIVSCKLVQCRRRQFLELYVSTAISRPSYDEKNPISSLLACFLHTRHQPWTDGDCVFPFYSTAKFALSTISPASLLLTFSDRSSWNFLVSWQGSLPSYLSQKHPYLLAGNAPKFLTTDARFAARTCVSGIRKDISKYLPYLAVLLKLLDYLVIFP